VPGDITARTGALGSYALALTRLAGAAILLAAWLLTTPALAQGLTVSFPSLDGQATRPPTELTARLFLPEGNGPFPAVVMLHGCTGMLAGEHLRARDAFWAEHWVAQGYAALLVDSYTPRGVASLCRTAVKDRPVSSAHERTRDAYGALRFLAARHDIDAAKIALVGWSTGASALLSAVRPAVKAAFASPGQGFRAAIAFYPGNCRILEHSGSWQPYLPVLILMGEADDWTPPGDCQALAEQAQGRHAPVEWKLYPGAYHDFDAPSAPVRERSVATPSGSAHTGTDPAARDDAIAAATDFIARHFATAS
jgi:dienelactone hydrolase